MTLRLQKIKNDVGIIHFIGIGGIGMSGIAAIFYNLGYNVQGSDISKNSNTERLEAFGIKIFYQHRKENIKKVEYVVVSSAIKESNPECIEALEKEIPIIKRSEMLAELVRMKVSIAISGSHGKTTTTSLVASIFERAGLKPTVINGGILNDKLTNAYIGHSDYLIAEADESDATFINIPATIAVITNIDKEHLDFYKTFDNLLDAFRKFITNLPFYGFAVVCKDDKTVSKLVDDIQDKKIITYGIDSKDVHIRAFNIVTNGLENHYDVSINLPGMSGSIIVEKVYLPIPGRHNVMNSLAAIAIAAELNLGVHAMQSGFNNFQGVKRRFTKVGEYKNIWIIDDYAHHPVEVKATIETARNIINKNNKQLTVIFQPHRYSRLKSLLNEFAKSFNEADQIYITEVFAAGETGYTVTSDDLITAIREQNKNVRISSVKDQEEVIQLINSAVIGPGLLLFMGAGNITQWPYNIFKKLLNGDT